MQCTNCGQFLTENEPYYREGGWNKTTFCSYSCIHDMYHHLCADGKIGESIQQYARAEEDSISFLKEKA